MFSPADYGSRRTITLIHRMNCDGHIHFRTLIMRQGTRSCWTRIRLVHIFTQMNYGMHRKKTSLNRRFRRITCLQHQYQLIIYILINKVIIIIISLIFSYILMICMLHIHYGDLDIPRIGFTTERIRKFAKVCQLFLSERKKKSEKSQVRITSQV